MEFDLHKEGDYRIDLKKKDLSTPKIRLSKNPEVTKEDYFKGKTGIKSNDYFGIDLSSFIEDPTLARNWEIWNKGQTGMYLSKFNEKTQKHVATLFTNQANYNSTLTELVHNRLVDNVIRLSYPSYDSQFDKSINRDITLYISGFIKKLLDQDNSVFCMRTVRERIPDYETGKYYAITAHPIKLSILKNCKNKDIYIYVPFVNKDYRDYVDFDNSEILVYGEIRERNVRVFSVNQNIFY